MERDANIGTEVGSLALVDSDMLLAFRIGINGIGLRKFVRPRKKGVEQNEVRTPVQVAAATQEDLFQM